MKKPTDNRKQDYFKIKIYIKLSEEIVFKV